jgi:hypothetical protein
MFPARHHLLHTLRNMVLEKEGLGLTIQLVSVQMFSPRVALPTTLMWTLELLVESFPAPSALPRRACCLAAIFVISFCFVAVSSTSSALAVGGRGGGRLNYAVRGLHLLRKLCLYLATKVGRVPCVH